jgi:wobble nucleotide-excising tRNase
LSAKTLKSLFKKWLIFKLIQHLNIDDWVNQGRNYLQSKTCPFCQEETITDDFKEQLKKYFDILK